MALTLGIDIGTFESKGVLADTSGAIVAMATRPHRMIVPRPGWAEHRADEDWWADFTAISRELLEGRDPREVTAVACSAIGPCMLPVDAAGTPLMNAVLYGVDTRAAAEIAELTAAIGADVLLERCGNALTSQSVGPKILWLRRNRPDLWARTDRVVTSTSHLVFRLTGETVIDHFTAASFSPLYDVAAQDWTSGLAPDLLGHVRLPRLMWSTEVAGTVTARAAVETGLAEGTPVTCGTIDAAAEAVSVGARAPGDMMMMYGSTVFIIEVTAARAPDARLWYAPWLFPGRHAAMAGLATSGTLTHWFRDQFARDLGADAFAVLAAEAAASPPGARGLLCLPYFSGERTPIHDPLAKGAFFGLNLTHTRGDLYRALIEGIAMGTAHVIETYAQTGQAPARILAVGGGTKNRLWLQATSDFGGVPQLVAGRTVGASYGNAFLAALATGQVAEADIERWNPPAETVVPAGTPELRRHYGRFRRLYEDSKALAHDLG
jgi:xylulokinase